MSSCKQLESVNQSNIRAHSIDTYLFGARELVFSIYPRFALRSNVGENQRDAPTCRQNLCSYSRGYQKFRHANFKYTVELMWTAKGQTKSVHNSEVSTFVKLGVAIRAVVDYI